MRAAVLLVATCLASIAYADTEQDVRCSEIAFSKSAELRDAKAFRSFIATPDCLMVGAAQVKNGVDDGTRTLLSKTVSGLPVPTGTTSCDRPGSQPGALPCR